MLFGMFCCGQIELAAGWGSTPSDLNDYLNVSYSGNETQLCVPSVLLKHTHTWERGEGGKAKEEVARRGNQTIHRTDGSCVQALEFLMKWFYYETPPFFKNWINVSFGWLYLSLPLCLSSLSPFSIRSVLVQTLNVSFPLSLWKSGKVKA